MVEIAPKYQSLADAKVSNSVIFTYQPTHQPNLTNLPCVGCGWGEKPTFAKTDCLSVL